MLLNNEDITEVFRDAYPNLCRFLESIVSDRAQDIAQESFLRLCAAEAGDISRSEMRFWLFRVARNLALNEVNREKTHNRLWVQVKEVFRRKNLTPAENLENAETHALIRDLLDKLPEHQRSALLLREEEDMRYREIALVLNVSESKVKVDIFRGRNALRDLWYERQQKGKEI